VTQPTDDVPPEATPSDPEATPSDDDTSTPAGGASDAPPPSAPTTADPHPITAEIELIAPPAVPPRRRRISSTGGRRGEPPTAAAVGGPSVPGVTSDSDGSSSAATQAAPPSSWQRLSSALHPRLSRAQVLAALLCAVLGFILVVQLQQNQEDELSGLRQSDLVRLLDDVSRRIDSLEREATSLRETESELRSGSDSKAAAIELAERNAAVQGILSGRLPAEGPGLEIVIDEGSKKISAARLFNVLEELRNAGAEAIEVNGIRMVASSHFEDSTSGVVIDGISVSPPYRWKAIGDPQTLQPAIAIPGGAVATIETHDGQATIQQMAKVQIKSVRDPVDFEYATAVPGEG
jgi:uncharacterized protein YlxW (UPF0749 family)